MQGLVWDGVRLRGSHFAHLSFALFEHERYARIKTPMLKAIAVYRQMHPQANTLDAQGGGRDFGRIFCHFLQQQG